MSTPTRPKTPTRTPKKSASRAAAEKTSLASLMTASNSVRDMVLACPIGAQRCKQSRVNAQADGDAALLKLFRRLSILRERTTQLHADGLTFEAAKVESDIPTEPEQIAKMEQQLYVDISQLQGDYMDLSCRLENSKLLLHRLKQHPVVVKSVFPTDSNTPEDMHAVKLFEQRDALVVQFMQIVEATEEVEKQLEQTISQSTARRTENRLLIGRLQAEQAQKQETTQAESNEMGRLNKMIQELSGQIMMVRHVFMSLVIESGVNWAEDEKLTALVMGDDGDD